MITLQDLTDRYEEEELISLTDRKNYETINIDVVNEAISDAESEVESYLNAVGLVGRDALGNLIYTKSATLPKALKIKTCDIARYYLFENGVTDIVQKRYDQAIAWLKLVQSKPTMLTGVTATGDMAKHSGIVVMPNVPPNQWTV